jgi:hypothetical protein
MSWSLVQRSPIDCGALLCVIWKLREWGGHGPRWAAGPKKNCFPFSIPVAARSKAWVCGHLLAEIVGPNYAGSIDTSLLSAVYCQVGLITRLEESYRLWCVWWVWPRSPLMGGHVPDSVRSASDTKNCVLSHWIYLRPIKLATYLCLILIHHHLFPQSFPIIE